MRRKYSSTAQGGGVALRLCSVLSDNTLTGTVPNSFSALLVLSHLDLSRNQLSGTLSSLASLTGLKDLYLSDNRFTGSIPEVLLSSASLRVLTLFKNSLTGPVNLSMASRLELFAAFDNELTGPLMLPAAECRLWVLLIFANRFSCEVMINADCPLSDSNRSAAHIPKLICGGKSAADCAKGLAAPGNRLQALPATGLFEGISGPKWDSTSSVSFLWAGTVWQRWRLPLIALLMGFVALLTAVATTGVIFLPVQPSLCVNLLPTAPAIQRGLPAVRTRLWRFVRFEPLRGIGSAQIWCARRLAWLAVPCLAMVLMANVFTHGLYMCGDSVTKYVTVAYIDDPAAEWALAVAACAFSCVAARLVLQFQQMLHAEYEPRTQSLPASSSAAVWCMYAQWAFAVALYTILPFAYALSTSLPSGWILPLISETTSLVLAIVTTVVIPMHCRNVSHRVFGAAGNPLLTSRLMQLARLWVSILAPALAVALVHEDCLGGWKLLWDRCNGSAGYFDVGVSYVNDDRPSTRAQNPRLATITLIKHSDVCDLRYRPGRCSSAVIENLGLLLLSKLAYASLLLPAGVLLHHTPFWRRIKEIVVRRFKPAYMAAYEVDSEFAAVLM